jgi:hypothetical protein
LSAIVSNRGGGIELFGQTHDEADPKNKMHGLRLCLVIAADTSDSWCTWTDPGVQFATFLCGTLTRTDAAINTSTIQLLPQAVLQCVHSFLKFKPDWGELERRVDTANLHMIEILRSDGKSIFELRPMTQLTYVYSQEQRKYMYIAMEVTPASLVREYRNFLELKIAQQDWHSKLLSPSMFAAPNGKKLVDEVTHSYAVGELPEILI